MKKIGIYVHVPFCVRKCFYCDFLSFPAGEKERERYVSGLLREISKESVRYGKYEVDSVFLGGGTPTVLSGEQIGRIMDGLRAGFSFGEEAEITIEANPGTVDTEKLESCRRAGINRISIGAQSLDDGELALLGRVHSAKDFLEIYGLAGKAGFRNVNVDIMAALPGQNPESYLNGLKRVIDLGPAHISAYSLMVEEGTPFYEWYGEDGKRKDGIASRFPTVLPTALPTVLPTEEEEREMYERTGEMLEAGGYYRYEISNYARPGYECRHNIRYWRRGDYAGFGLGASSMVENVRWKNSTDMGKYLCCMEEGSGDIKEEQCVLGIRDQMEEFMFLGLRMSEGVGKKDFYNAFGKSLEDVYGEIIEKLCAQGLLMDGDSVRLTPYGRDISNYVMAEFLQ